MFSKIVFVLAAVCVVNASVITVNVFDDAPETEVASNPKECNFQACDQLCRRLKFTGGACVNGRCQCDNFLNAEDGVSEKSLSNLENSVLQQDDPEAEVAAKPSRCNLKVCDLVCRWLNKTSGACVDGRCKCTKSLIAEDEFSEKPLYKLENTVLQQDDPESQVENKKSDCNNQACDQLCRRLKFPGGACVNGRCQCDNFLNAEDDPEAEVENKKSDCNNQACDQLCRRLKFTGGACVNGRCKCDNFLKAEESLSNPEDFISPRACDSQQCYNLCRKIKLRGGACIDEKCICNKYLSEQENDMTDTAEFLSPGSCNFRACDQQCFRFGFPGGTCVDGRCKCDNFLNKEVSESNIEYSVQSKACNNKRCNQLCRKQKFRGGACLGANCYCNKFYSLLEDTMTDSAESLPLSYCNSIACDDQCRRTGWHSGVCIDGQCKCDYFLNTEVTENTLSDLEDSISPRRCTYQACNELCRRLKFPGGACVNGRCKCDNFFGTEDAVDEYLEFAPRSICKVTKCNRKCTRRGYEGAICVNGRCKCYKNLQEKDRFPLNDVTSNENGESNVGLKTIEEELTVPSPSACNTVTCNQMCHRLNYAGGWCRFGQCQCY